MATMNRREVLKTSSVLLGGTLVVSSGVLAACSTERAPRQAAAGEASSANDQQLMAELADTILPTTPASPGAMAAGIAPDIARLLGDCYDAASQERMRRGLEAVRTVCRERFGGGFTKLSPGEREKLVVEIDAESAKAGAEHWFHLMRELALQAYFASEVGMTRALRYVRVPGHWTGCLPLEQGQPAWG